MAFLLLFFFVWVFCAKNWDVQVDSVTFWDFKRMDRPRGSVTVPKGRLEFVNWVEQSSKKSDLI